jgi:DnaJ domain
VADDWEVLGVRPGATHEEVRARWLALAKELHPDHGGGPAAAARLAEVNAAYGRLRQGPDNAGAVRPGPDNAARPNAGAPGGGAPGERRAPGAGARTAGARAYAGEGDGAPPTEFAVDDFRPGVFEAVLLAAVDVGDVTRTDEPFSLDMWVGGGSCHVELFPQAGGSVVSVDCANVDAGEVAEALAAAIASQGLRVTLSG